MTSDTTRLGVMDLEGDLFADLSTFDIDEVDVVSSGVDHGPESHRISDLSVEPDILVGGEGPCELGTDNSNDIAQHGNEDKTSIEGKDETSTTGRPDGEFQSVKTSQLDIGRLTVPAVGKQSKVGAVKKNVKGKPPWDKELAMKPGFNHY